MRSSEATVCPVRGTARGLTRYVRRHAPAIMMSSCIESSSSARGGARCGERRIAHFLSLVPGSFEANLSGSSTRI